MGMILQKGIDNALYDPLLPEYAAVKAAVDAAITADSTVGAAVENAGLYAGLTSQEEKEARAVFAAMPPTLNKAILAALGNAFDRGLVIRVNWVEITQGLMHAHFEESTDKTTLLVQLWTRDGATYLTSSRPVRVTNWVAAMHTRTKRTAKKRSAAKRAPAKRSVKKRATAKRPPAKRTAKKRTAAKRAPAKRSVKRRATAKRPPAKRAAR